MRPPWRVESGAFPPPTNGNEQPHPGREGGNLLPLSGGTTGMKGVRAYRSRRYTRHSATLRPASLAPVERLGASRLFILGNFHLPLAPRPISLPPPETRTLDISNATSQRGDIRLFRKVVKCTARLRDGGRFWRPAHRADCAISAIGYVVEFHYRIPSSSD